MKNNKKAFTLVELVVVAVILSILATVGFISYEDYIVDTRDSKRLAQLTGLRDSMRLATTKGALPLPDENVEIRNNSTAFLYQGYAGKNVLESISYSESTVDPFDDVHYTYLVSRNRKDFQLMGFLEKYNPEVISGLLTDSYASIDYSQRYPNVFGKKLGILLEQQTNTPLQEMNEYVLNGYMDLQDTTSNEFDAYVTDLYLISGKEDNLVGIIPFTTCKKILESGNSYGDGIYNINPTGLNPFEVYCIMDQDIDNGGWTLVARSHESGTADNFGWLFSRGSIRDDTQAYSLGSESVSLNFSEIMIASYDSGKNIEYAAKTSIIRNYIKTESNYNTDSLAEGCDEVFPTDISWKSPCDSNGVDGKVTDESALNRWGLIHYPANAANDSNGISNTPNDTHYFFHQYGTTDGSDNRYGLRTNGWLKGGGGSGTNYDSLGDLNQKQGMIFVR